MRMNVYDILGRVDLRIPNGVAGGLKFLSLSTFKIISLCVVYCFDDR